MHAYIPGSFLSFRNTQNIPHELRKDLTQWICRTARGRTSAPEWSHAVTISPKHLFQTYLAACVIPQLPDSHPLFALQGLKPSVGQWNKCAMFL